MGSSAPSQAIPAPETQWLATLKNIWQWSRRTVTTRKPKRLRVCETLSLGERRFLAVIEFERQEFLVGGTGSSLELLARLKEGKVLPEHSLPSGSRPF